jgi:hypothetical protein
MALQAEISGKYSLLYVLYIFIKNADKCPVLQYQYPILRGSVPGRIRIRPLQLLYAFCNAGLSRPVLWSRNTSFG